MSLVKTVISQILVRYLLVRRHIKSLYIIVISISGDKFISTIESQVNSIFFQHKIHPCRLLIIFFCQNCRLLIIFFCQNCDGCRSCSIVGQSLRSKYTPRSRLSDLIYIIYIIILPSIPQYEIHQLGSSACSSKRTSFTEIFQNLFALYFITRGKLQHSSVAS